MYESKSKSSGKALIPFLIFVVVYLASGIILQAKGVEMAFYQLPGPVAVLVGIIIAFIMFKGSVDEKFGTLVQGCGDENIIIMCIIYLLAGAFSSVSEAIGGVDATVNLGLTLIPAKYATAGIFIIAGFISISTGTSVGTIVAIGPIAVGLAEKAGLNLSLVIAALIGGAMFGDNLSIISDTTIAATRTQGVEMRDKFRLNIRIALPAAIITIILLLIFGQPTTVSEVGDYSFNIIKVLPYLFVLVAALAGVNVFIVLTGGIIFSGIIGIAYRELGILTFAQEVFSGFEGMFDIFLLSMLTGGLAFMVTKEGGLQWILEKIQGRIKGKKTAEIGIAALISLIDAATANNTVAIIISGPIVKEISKTYKVDPRRTASLLDAFSCVMQGMIPYGAQLLIAASFTKGLVSPIEIIPLLWYQQLLALAAIISIFIPYADGIIKREPWDFTDDKRVV